MTAYEEFLSATSTADSQSYVIPADDKDNSRLIVSQIVLDTFEALKKRNCGEEALRLFDTALSGGANPDARVWPRFESIKLPHQTEPLLRQ